jgi:membrane protein implicated in regulation of membrane protease activity
MHALFLICLVSGLGSTGLLALFGGLSGHVGHGPGHLSVDHAPAPLPTAHGHLALPGGGPAHGHLALPHAGQVHPTLHGHAQPTPHTGGQSSITAVTSRALSWLSPLVIALAALWFGAGGLIADLAAPVASGPVAIVAAIAGATLARLLMTAFARADTEPLSAAATGAIGVLNAPIRADGVGEVVYVLEGLHRSAAARSQDGAPLPRGTNVVIVRRERGIAYVSPLDPLSGLGEPDRGEGPPDGPITRQALP